MLLEAACDIFNLIQEDVSEGVVEAPPWEKFISKLLLDFHCAQGSFVMTLAQMLQNRFSIVNLPFFIMQLHFAPLYFFIVHIRLVHLLDDLGIEELVQIDAHKDLPEDEEGAEESSDIW